jgi:hypothetical protein
MSDSKSSRREALRAAAAAALGGSLTLAAGQHVHRESEQNRKAAGAYKPKALNQHEFRTLDALSERIIPGAKQAGAAEFIDTLAAGSRRLAAIFTGGLAWIDSQMKRRFDDVFLDAKPEQQAELLDQIAYRRNASPDLNAGITFFDWARRLTVDAYFTSKVGIAALAFQGNTSMQEYQVPAEALQYALKRSPLA